MQGDSERGRHFAKEGWQKAKPSHLWQAPPVPFHTPLEQLSFVSLDLETTGLVPGFDAITEIGAARFRLKDGGIVVPGPVFEELVNPEREISQKVAELTGIDDAMVAVVLERIAACL